MNEQKTYSKAPVIEVVCVLSIDSPETLTEEQVCAFKNKITDDFPGYSESTKITAHPENETRQYKFISKDKNISVTLSNKVIEFHLLNNYTTADELYAKLTKIYDSYSAIIQTSKIRYCQLGYLNKIIVPNKTVNLSEYFTFTPNPKRQFVNFVVGYEIEDDEKYRTSLSLVPTKSESETDSTFILDIRGVTSEHAGLSDDFRTILQKLHNNIKTEFESAITDDTKKLFEVKT